MIAKSTVIFVLAGLSAVSGFPLRKRIAQTIADSTTFWEQACLNAGGGQQCNPLSITAFTTLLAAAGPCDQQNAADQMIDLAKTLNNDPDMIKFTQLFAQQARNSPDSLSEPYCDQAPKNPELNGLFQCQFQSVNPKLFVGNVAVGGPNTIPFALNGQPVNPPGSCPAHPQGPIADGSQLTDITQDPGVPASGGSSSGGNGNDNNGGSSSSSTKTKTKSKSAVAEATSTPVVVVATTTAAAATVTTPASTSNNPSFALQNGEDAQKLNAQFTSLTPDSPCSSGDQACINGDFALCSNGQFVLMPCGGGLTCAALPLVNEPGTSVTCTTQQDAVQRIADTGATGGFTGSG